MKKITILGSTGSIGTQALDVCEKNGFEVIGLSTNMNLTLLEEQVRKFKPKYIAVNDEVAFKKIKATLSDINVKILNGIEGLCELASLDDNDIVLNSVVGMVGLRPTLAAINAKCDVALANKEILVVGGELVMAAALKNNVNILPVDSEHSAIFQCLNGNNLRTEINRIILTASGGPFFGKTADELKSVKAIDALRHPNWNMGAKITIDSATMMNKGLELIEAKWLFDVEPSNIDIVVHRQSVVHSLVEFVDNSVLAQLGVPDMRIPIQYALTYPKRYESPVKKLSLTDYKTLTFEEPDYDAFPAMNICKAAINRGGLAPCAVNCANEEAVGLFLDGKIGFLDISALVLEALNNQPDVTGFTVDDILKTETVVRSFVRDLALKFYDRECLQSIR